MSITVYPYKLTQRELEARLEPGLTVLPGQYLRFATPEPIFGQVREVRALPPSSPGLLGGYRLLIELLYGTPSLHAQQVVLLSAEQMGHEIQRLQEPIEQPLRLTAGFSAEFERLGASTVITGDDFLQKYKTLTLLMRAVQPYRRVVILDPLGVFSEEDGCTVWHAGTDVRLSLQMIGSRNFLDTFGEMFAPGLRESALRIVADHLPPLHEFMGFTELLEWYESLNVPLKNLILQNLQLVAQTGIFADTLEQSLDWARSGREKVLALNCAGLEPPWRGLFYRQALQALWREDSSAIVPVLIYPENYVPDLFHYVQQADELEFKMLMLVSPYVDNSLLDRANNRFCAESLDKVELKGSLTLGLPLSLPLTTSTVSPKRPDVTAPASLAPTKELPNEPAIESSLFDGSLFAEDIPYAGEAPALREGPVGSFSSFNIPLVEHEEVNEPPDDQSDRDLALSGPEETSEHWLSEAAQMTDWSEPEPFAEEEEDEIEPEFQFEEQDLALLEEVDDLPELTQSEDEETILPVEETLLPPIVDLSAPLLEAAPEFLTASQLSQLLSSGKTGTQESSPAAQLLEIESYTDVPVPASTPKAEPPKHKAVVEEVQPLVQPMVAPVTETVTPEPEPPAQVSFPAPEEFAKEDFYFDLNPDEFSVESFLTQANAYQTQDAVSESLSQFSSSDAFAADEPFFDADLGTDGTKVAGTSVGLSEKERELHEALDLIFPHQQESTRIARELSPAQAVEGPVIPTVDEPVPIVQKTPEPMTGDAAAFRPGDKVIHDTYGQGIVQKVIPTEDSVVLNITFETVGKRLLDPALCELTREAVS